MTILKATFLASPVLLPATAQAEISPEKDQFTLGFIKLTDMPPLAVATEQGYVLDEGLFVTLQAQANWKVLLDGVIDGTLEGAQMLAGQPLAATFGYSTPAHIVTPLALDLNGNGITGSNEVWGMIEPGLAKGAAGLPLHPIGAASLRPALDAVAAQDRPFNMGMVFPVSPHNHELRTWLAAGGIDPGLYAPGDATGQVGAEVLLPATLEAGTIAASSVGEPWNQQAVAKEIGVPVITDADIFRGNPEKVFALTAEFVAANPNITLALTRAEMWLDAVGHANREAAVDLLAQPDDVGADRAVIAASMTGTFEYAPGDVFLTPDLDVVFDGFAGYPFLSDAIWTLTQMRRWGQIPEGHPDQWSADLAGNDGWPPESFLVSAITVTLCSLWPTLINTALGVARIDRDLVAVSRLLRMGTFARITRMVLPSALLLIFTGLRLSLGVGWMALIAAAMLARNPGLGKFVWDEFQNGCSRSLARIMVAVLAIDLIGFALDRVMQALQALVTIRAGRGA